MSPPEKYSLYSLLRPSGSSDEPAEDPPRESAPAEQRLLPPRMRLSFAERHKIWRGIRVQLLIDIKRTARLIDRALIEHGARAMLPERQRRVLEYLDRSGCSPCISDVARHLQISRQAAQRVVIHLRTRGFVAPTR